MQLSIDSYWSGYDGVLFRIIEIGEGPDPWVHYENVNTHQEYTCKAQAFTHRFSRTEHDPRT